MLLAGLHERHGWHGCSSPPPQVAAPLCGTEAFLASLQDVCFLLFTPWRWSWSLHFFCSPFVHTVAPYLTDSLLPCYQLTGRVGSVEGQLLLLQLHFGTVCLRIQPYPFKTWVVVTMLCLSLIFSYKYISLPDTALIAESIGTLQRAAEDPDSSWSQMIRRSMPWFLYTVENCSLWLNTCCSWSPKRGATSHLVRLSRSRWHLQGCSVPTVVGGTSPLFCRRETSGCKREDLCVAWRTLQLLKDGLNSLLCSS